ncbi:MAG TPA: LLM class flavin-dependent oxidoreductase [Candidatus Binatia bacterium]|jgi:alkanesulfonate monooxygenase SsuD/methylene tetrahydromethanopterin reductase-like flavin-dependent oxidoreductase (luciferase family)
MKIGLFTEFSNPGKSEQQTYAEVLEQIGVADELGFDFFSTTESYGKDLFSCSPFPLGLYVAAAQRAKRIRFLTGIISAPLHHPAILASEIAAADLLTQGRIMVGIGRGHPWVLNRVGVNPAESTARFEESIRMLVEIFKSNYIESLDGEYWQIKDFKLSPPPVQQPHPPIYTAAATTPDSASFAGKIGHGLVQPGYLGIPFELVRGLTGTYRGNLPNSAASDVVLGIHLHVARNREEAIENGALALATQADVFLRSSQSRPNLSGVKEAYATKSASRMAFEKLSTPDKAKQAVAAEGANIMAVWGAPDDCVEKLKFYIDALRPEQLMLNIASGSLPQEKALRSMRIFAEDVMPALREL